MTWFKDLTQITLSTIKLNLLTLGPKNDTLGKSAMDPWVAAHVMGQYLSLYERPFP